MLQCQLHVFYQDFFGRVLREQQNVEASVGCGQIGDIAMSLDIEFESFESFNGHSISSCDKNHEAFSLFFA